MYVCMYVCMYQQSVHGLCDGRLEIARVHAVREVLALQGLVGIEDYRVLQRTVTEELCMYVCILK